MANNDGSVRSISWQDVCPWTLLFSLFRISVSLPVLVLALLAACATTAGWRLADGVFLSDRSTELAEVHAFAINVESWPGAINEVEQAYAEFTSGDGTALSLGGRQDNDRRQIDGRMPMFKLPDARVLEAVVRRTPIYALVEPFRRIVVYPVSWDQFFFYAAGGFWSLLVWCLFGGAITRIAVVRLGREERVGLFESLTFARRKWASYFGAPLMPLCAIALLGLPLMLTGFVMRLDLGILVAGALWALVGLTGLGMAVFGIGLLFGWPLMWATISTEGTDAFDAISRSYAYTYQRPLNYLFYVTLSTLVGLLGWFLVAFFCDTVIGLSEWAIGWGAGSSRLDAIGVALTDEGSRGAPALLWSGAHLIRFFTSCIRGFLTAYGLGFFWVASAGVYLLLRRDTDQTETDDVYLEDDDELTIGLPSLTVDEAGVPGVDEPTETQGETSD